MFSKSPAEVERAVAYLFSGEFPNLVRDGVCYVCEEALPVARFQVVILPGRWALCQGCAAEGVLGGMVVV